MAEIRIYQWGITAVVDEGVPAPGNGPSDEEWLEDPDPAPEGDLAVRTLNAIDITTTDATLRGNLDAVGEGPPVEVWFTFGTSPGDLNFQTPVQSLSATGAFQEFVGNLNPATVYYFRAHADDGTTQVTGNILSFMTACVSGTAPDVETLSAVNVFHDRARLRGNLNDLGSATSVLVGFEIGLADGAFDRETPLEVMTAGGIFYFRITGLATNTQYFFRAKAFGDCPAFGATLSFTTDDFVTEAVAPAVSTLAATNVEATSATIRGDLTNLGTASEVTVWLRWGTDAGSLSNITPRAFRTTTGVFSEFLGALAPETTYHFQAVADGDFATISTGSVLSFTTPAATPPPAPTSPDLEVVTHHARYVTHESSLLRGEIVSMGGASSVNAFFRWGTDPASLSNTTTPATHTSRTRFHFHLTGLAPSTTYFYQAVGESNPTAEGDILSFTTLATAPLDDVIPGLPDHDTRAVLGRIPYTNVEVERMEGNFSGGGWRASLKVRDLGGVTVFPDFAQVVVWAEDIYGVYPQVVESAEIEDDTGVLVVDDNAQQVIDDSPFILETNSFGGRPGCEDILLNAHLRENSVLWQGNPESGFEQDLTFQIETLDAAMREMTAWPITFAPDDAPNSWHEITDQTLEDIIDHVLRHHTNLLLMTDWLSRDMERRIDYADLSEGTVWQQINDELATARGGQVVVGRHNQLWIRKNVSLLSPEEFDAWDQEIFQLDNSWWMRFEIGQELGRFRVSQIEFVGFELDLDDPIYVIVPEVQGSFGRLEKITGYLVAGEAEARELAEAILRRENIRFPAVTFDTWNVRLWDPADQPIVSLFLTQADTLRRMLWANIQFIVREATYDIHPAGAEGSIQCTYVLEAFPLGHDAIYLDDTFYIVDDTGELIVDDSFEFVIEDAEAV